MIGSEGFNPFSILPRELMLHILLQTYGKENAVSLESLFDYEAVNTDFRSILADEENLKYILDSMPREFNIDLITSLRQRKIVTDEGRYRAGLALLFLKYLYGHIKPFPDDEFIQNQFDDYFMSLAFIETNYTDYPMPMYVCGYVAFYIAKRLMTLNPLDKELQQKGAKIYMIAVHCLVRAHELEHPLARIFHGDMDLQMQRVDIDMNDFINEPLPVIPAASLAELLTVLAKDLTINLKIYSDEMQTLLLVTWQKLILENYRNASELFAFTLHNEKLINITEYFYNCYQVNHFHRHILAFNPLFLHVEQKEKILYLLQSFTVDALVNLHQGFQVYHPRPDSVLLSALLMMSMNELKDFRTIVSDSLALPQTGMPGWKICFLDAYRNAIDDGALKSVSSKQMRMALKYFTLVNRSRKINAVL
ncbi:MAG: hypothetical protein M3R00_05680, partial [Pseudomonadota bacterium]|nr:hypothetical protein [Pseudomonadota bacterium]